MRQPEPRRQRGTVKRKASIERTNPSMLEMETMRSSLAALAVRFAVALLRGEESRPTMKSTFFLFASLCVLCGHSSAAQGPLCVVNGDFSDLSELQPFGGSGWYQGVPAGWRASSKTPFYSVHTGADGKQPACNVSQLGVLEQNVGTLTQAADVVLTMDVADEWRKGAELNAEIQDADGETLGSIQLQAGRTQRLVAGKVPAGTTISIRFQALNGTTPALDNVAVASFAPRPRLRRRR